jgi:hypothetical protein
MFLFLRGRRKSARKITPKPVVPVIQEPKEEKPLRFYGYGNSVCIMGKAPWPPMIKDHSGHDRTDLFAHIADALNVKHRYNFVRKQLALTVAAYDRGDIDKQKVADDLIHMLQVIRADEKRDEPLFAEHSRKLAEYERSNGNWGG